jgi:uncharacterized damage-inducible protein DinB
MKALLETWSINQRMNVLLLKSVSDEFLSDVASAKGRSAGEQFAHIHNVRLMWLKASLPELLADQQKLEKEQALSKKNISNSLTKSATAISALLESGFSSGRIKGFKPHPEAFLGYLIAHEAHHRGQIIITLKENNHMPDKKTLYGLWEWGVR